LKNESPLAQSSAIKINAFLWSSVVLGCLTFLLWKLLSQKAFETDIFSIIPDVEISSEFRDAANQFIKRQENRVVFLLEAKQVQPLETSLKQLYLAIDELNQKQDVITVSIDDDFAEKAKAFFTELAPYRSLLLSPSDAQLLKDMHLAKLSQRLKNNFVDALSFGVTPRFAQDPFGFYESYIAQFSRSGGKSRQGALLLEKNNKAYLLTALNLNGAIFDEQVQQVFMAFESSFRSHLEAGVSLYSTGVIYHAARTREIARNEITLISSLSLLGVFCLILFTFKRVMPILSAALVLSVGLLCALTLSLLVFQRVHILTLVFGASVIGIAVDYAFHFFAHLYRDQCSGNTALLNIRSAILIGFLTSVFGFFSLILTRFPALEQLAIFSIGGLAGAFGTVFCWLRALPQAAPSRIPKIMVSHPLLDHFYCRKGWFYAVLAILVIFFSLFSMVPVKTNDDIRLLRIEFSDLEAASELLFELTGERGAQGFFVVKAESIDELLYREKLLTTRLEHLQNEGVVEQYHAISKWLPPTESLVDNQALLTDSFIQKGVAKDLFEQIGLLPQVSDQYLKTIRDPSLALQYRTQLSRLITQHPLSEQWMAADNGLWFSQVRVSFSTAAIEPITDVTDLSGVVWYDKVASINLLFEQFRKLSVQFLSLAYFVIALLFCWRYGIKKGIATLLPSMLAITVAMWVLVLLDIELNLFHILASIIVLAVGIDFSLFINESRIDFAPAVLASGLSALTTILAFGLLAFSRTAALASFGQVICIGIIVVYLFAPISLALLPRSLRENHVSA
jgi:predicted exporter